MLPRNVLYYGKEASLPERKELRAGPLPLIYEEGDLRSIRLGDREVLRRVYVAIRDRNWDTVPPVLSNTQMDVTPESFRITYDVENRQGNLDFFWQGTITGDPDGRITFTMDGVARSTFLRNRIGFCVLHPAGCAGIPCVVEHVDGTTEHANLPVYIVADQPVEPFARMSAIAHQVAPGLWARVAFAGDVFEMEDQRNWTDASYKTFCTPLRLPYPVEIRAGTRITQSVTLTLPCEEDLRRDERQPHGLDIPGMASGLGTREGPAEVAALPREDAGTTPRNSVGTTLFEFGAGATAVPIPPIGLGVASTGQSLSEREIERLKVLRLRHLRVDLRLANPSYAAQLKQAVAEAGALGVPLEVALILSEKVEDELERFKRVLLEVNPPVATWLVYPAKERFLGGSPTAEVVTAARKHLASERYDSSQNSGRAVGRLAAGTNTDFIFMQRTMPPLSLLDAVAFSINPQVHAFDNASLAETLATQATAVTSARRLAGPLPVLVSPITLKMRFNAYATGEVAPTPPNELPPQVDERQMSLFGAGWTLGSIKYMAESGAAGVTYYETTGWRGVMETEAGSPLPKRFRSLPGSVFPMYHVFADVGEFAAAGGQVIPCRSSDPLRVEGLVLSKGDARRVLLANLTPQAQQVIVPGALASVPPAGQAASGLHSPADGSSSAPARVTIRYLDETNAEQAMLAPEAYRSQPGKVRHMGAEPWRLELLPYAVARLDMTRDG
jgi:hypothetical protein